MVLEIEMFLEILSLTESALCNKEITSFLPVASSTSFMRSEYFLISFFSVIDLINSKKVL